MIAEPMVTDGDTPRTRRTDPLASHKAADRSQPGLLKLKVAALLMLEKHGPLDGARANNLYAAFYAGFGEFPTCAPDSIRKRLGELADPVKGDCLVDVVDYRRGTLEAVYQISAEGKRYLEGLK